MPLTQSSSSDGGYREACADEGREDAACEDAHPLLGELTEGNLAAFWKLWEQHRQYLYGVCLRQMGGVHADAEDALSRAMITAWRRLPHHADKIPDRRSLRGWLARLTRNLCVDIHRERQRHGGPHRSLDEFTPEYVEAAGGAAESPEDSLLRRERELYLHLLIARLSPSLRTPFVLRFFHGVPYSDIAARLELSSENVRKRIQQARSILQDRLGDYRAGLTDSAMWLADIEGFEELFAGLFVGDELFAAEAAREPPRPPCTVRTVCALLPSGVERSFDLLLEESPREAGAAPGPWDWEETVGELYRHIARRPDATAAHVRLGELLHLAGRSAEALSVYERALRAEPGEPMRRHLCGLAELCRGRYARAASAFQQAALLEPHAPAHRHRLGLTRLRAGAYAEALEAFDELLRRNPDDVVALTFSRDPLTSAGRTREAVRRLRRAVRLDPQNGPALRWLVGHRLTQGAVAGAEGQETRRLLRLAERAAPDAPEVRELTATYHIRRGEWEEGVALLEALVGARPLSPAAWRALSDALARTGQYQQAADVILEAYALHPSEHAIQEAACEVLALARRPALRRVLRETLARDPEHWGVWAAAGLALVGPAGGDAELACSASARATQLRPQLAEAWFRHGRVLALAGRHREALAALTRGWGLLADDACEPEALAAAVRLGESWAACGGAGPAREWFETAVRRAPAQAALTPAAAHFWHGRALEALGRGAAAVQSYSEALAAHVLYPERQEALERLERLTDRRARRSQTGAPERLSHVGDEEDGGGAGAEVAAAPPLAFPD